MPYDHTSPELRNISGSQQYGNLVIWFLASPTGDESDSLNLDSTFENKTVCEVFHIRKEVHRMSNTECPQLTSENLAHEIKSCIDSGFKVSEIG